MRELPPQQATATEQDQAARIARSLAHRTQSRTRVVESAPREDAEVTDLGALFERFATPAAPADTPRKQSGASMAAAILRTKR